MATTNDGMVQGSRTRESLDQRPGRQCRAGSQTTATLTIQDNDVGGIGEFSSPAVSVLEGDSAVLTLTRTGGTGGNVSVVYGTSDITATGGTDYAASAGLVVLGPRPDDQADQYFHSVRRLRRGRRDLQLTLSSPTGRTIGSLSRRR